MLRLRVLQPFVAALSLLLLVSTVAWADPEPPVLAEASSACLLDAQGQVLFASDADEELPMASITKIMTAMVALDSGISLDEPVSLVEEPYPEGYLTAGYRDGDVVTFGELLRVMLIYSANDAASNVAYAVAGSREAFADLMNQRAAELGLTHTHFVNPYGLEEPGHYSSAYDLCVMGRYAMEHYPFIVESVHTRQVTTVVDGRTVTFDSTDDLMGVYDGLRGIKTGNTESGTAFLGSARRNHVTLYSCVLCCDTLEGRFADTRTLLDWGFARYDGRLLVRQGWQLRNACWRDGFWLRLPVSARRDVVGSVCADEGLSYTTVMFRPGTLLAEGETCGTTVWTQDDRQVDSVNYLAGRGSVGTCAWSPLVAPALHDREG